MHNTLIKKGWKVFSTLNQIYFKNGWFLMLNNEKIVNVWKSTVFYKVVT